MNNPLTILTTLDSFLVRETSIVPIHAFDARFLRLARPSVTDLILTKMMRSDSQDIGDIRFLLSRERLAPEALVSAFRRASCPPIPEIRETFEKLQPRVLEMAVNEFSH